jgi:hypothetical protein
MLMAGWLLAESSRHVDQGLLTGYLVAGAVGLTRTIHSSHDRLQLLWRYLTQLTLSGSDRPLCRLSVRRRCGALGRGQPGSGVRMLLGVDLGPKANDLLRT